MSKIDSVFGKGHKALIPYVTVGYPDVETTLRVVPLLERCGCDIVELGIPFSDPLADGATIQKASFYALKNGVTPQTCLEIAGKLSRKVKVPLVFMTYYNPVLNYGLEKFCNDCKASGISGLIVPDLPPEEGEELERVARAHGIDLIYLLSPTSTEKRIRLVAEKSCGFVYLVSVAGVTGARDRLPEDTADFIDRVKKATNKPLCLGFGISTPEQAGFAARLVSGVIVGSRIIQLMESDKSLGSLEDFVRSLRQALDAVTPP